MFTLLWCFSLELSRSFLHQWLRSKISLTVQHHKNQIQAVQLSKARSTHCVFRQSNQVGDQCDIRIRDVCGLLFALLISVAVIDGNRPNIALRRFSVFPLTLIGLNELNSSLNPLIYRMCWKMRHIRHAIISLRSKHSRTTRTKMQPEYEKTP